MTKTSQRLSAMNWHKEKQKDGSYKKINHYEEHKKALRRKHVKKQAEAHARALKRKEVK